MQGVCSLWVCFTPEGVIQNGSIFKSRTHTSGHFDIREIPDHATFRGKGVNTGLVRQTWGLSLFGPM